MMVVCQTHSIKLRLINGDGSITILHYGSRKERDADRAWYASHGFKVK